MSGTRAGVAKAMRKWPAQLERGPRAARFPWHVLRADGVLLGGYSSHADAERGCAVMTRDGELAGLAYVVARGGR